jgi:putative phosphoribosyl transferase
VKLSNREESGRLLAEPIAGLGLDRSIVVAIGEDGLTVARACAGALAAPLGWYGAAALRLPWRPSLSFGAVTDDDHHYLDAEVVADHCLGTREIAAVARAALPLLRAARPRRPDLVGRAVVLVADALDTGYRALAVARAARAAGAAHIAVATPCAARDAADRVAASGLVTISLVVSDAPRFDADAFYPPAALPRAAAR